MRMITSCLECRRRKLRCSKSQPCSNCKKFGLRECVYLGPQLDEASQLWLTEIKEKVGSLELQLERVVSDAATGSAGPSRQLQYRPSPVRQSIIDEVDQPDLELTPLASLDLTYDYDADGVDDLFDLGVRIGKMRLTERVGGLSRTRLSEEVGALHPDPCELSEGQVVAAASLENATTNDVSRYIS